MKDRNSCRPWCRAIRALHVLQILCGDNALALSSPAASGRGDRVGISDEKMQWLPSDFGASLDRLHRKARNGDVKEHVGTGLLRLNSCESIVGSETSYVSSLTINLAASGPNVSRKPVMKSFPRSSFCDNTPIFGSFTFFRIYFGEDRALYPIGRRPSIVQGNARIVPP